MMCHDRNICLSVLPATIDLIYDMDWNIISQPLNKRGRPIHYWYMSSVR